MHTKARRLYAALAAVVLAGAGASAQLNSTRAPACGAPAAHPRRGDAVLLARQINTAQARAFRETKAYQALEMLGVTMPAGSAVQLVTNESGYIFTIKDTEDPCGFSVFSDQKGVIYLAQALR